MFCTDDYHPADLVKGHIATFIHGVCQNDEKREAFKLQGWQSRCTAAPISTEDIAYMKEGQSVIPQVAYIRGFEITHGAIAQTVKIDSLLSELGVYLVSKYGMSPRDAVGMVMQSSLAEEIGN